ncbi:MAG TPA: MFS transporter [Thermomicrobiales bacterium]|jgi:DHA1 family multidrug resistance protein-like MFS transporter
MAADNPAEQDGVPGWQRGVALAVAAQLISMMGFSCAGSFLPLYIQTIGVPDPARAALWAGGLSFSQAIMVTLCSPLWGAVADRYGAKLMVCRALFGGGVLYIVISFVDQVRFLPALFLLLGCFTGVNTAIVTLVAGLAPRKNFSTAIGACQTGVFIGISVGPAIGGFLADTFSYRVGIRSGAVLLLLSGALVLLGITEAHRTATRSSARPSILGSLRAVGGSRPLFLLIGLIFLIQFSLQMMSPVLPIFVQQLSPNATRIATTVGVIIGVGGFTSAIGALLCGRAADRFGQRKILGWATAGGGVTIGLQALVTEVAPLIGLRGLSGIFTGGLNAGANASLGALVPTASRGAAFGIAGSAFSLGNALGPLLGGALAGAIGPRAVIGLSAVALLCGCGLVQLLGQAERHRFDARTVEASD